MNEEHPRRDIIRELFEKTVYGPLFGENEVLDTHPLNLYMTGILCPRDISKEPNAVQEPEDIFFNTQNQDIDETFPNNEVIENREMSDGNSESESEDPKLTKYSINISSFGMTFICESSISELNVVLDYTYYLFEEDLPFETYIDKNGQQKPIVKYKYIAQKCSWNKSIETSQTSQLISIPHSENGLELELVIRIQNTNKKKIVSLFLSNISPVSKDFKLRERKTLPLLVFRPSISVDITEDKIIDVGSTVKIDFLNDDENDMLYRKYKRYGRGHNCAVSYNEDTKNIQTRFLPFQRTKWLKTDWDDTKDIRNFSEVFNVKDFLLNHDISKNTVIEKLQGFAASYENWINSNSIPEKYGSSFNKNKINCVQTKERIDKGIQLLSSSDLIYSVWQDAHSAMQRQFEISNRNLIYRPFQIAFLLLMIECIVNDKSEDREIADLLWIPTGGGKTEAYLAVSAFTILFRRKYYGNDGNGLAIISRYTLRLLTAQQFERTAKLVCALELIRKEKETDYGTDPISLGLFIGSTSSPNKVGDAKNTIIRGATHSFPLQRCPWCGKELSNISNSVTETKNAFSIMRQTRFVIRCINSDCEFHSKLPVQFVDQMLEKETPTMIICTADKFAMMPFQFDKFKKIIMSGRHPELIIQDELHLIDSSLGSIFGLYETTNSLLWEKNHKIKIIASTATPKEAESQLKLLFNRKISTFPKPLTNIDDTFFSRLEDKEFGRCYIGFMPTSTSAKNSLIAAMASFLAASVISKNEKTKKDSYGYYFLDDANDPYKLLTCYFNSIRELGSTSATIDDDVIKKFESISKYLYVSNEYNTDNTIDYIKEIKDLNKTKSPRRNNYPGLDRIELTGRVSSKDLTFYLNRLEKKDKALPDILMSTNMISVGIDIPDLNLMIVNGQPKKVAEYIQASSRTGRHKNNPGLILTLYNPVKLRDISFYEYFNSFHQTFYRYIEPVSVTPFSSQSLRRGLYAQMISLLRDREPKLDNHITHKTVYSFENLLKAMIERIGEDDKEKIKEVQDNFNKIRESKMENFEYVIQAGNPMYAYLSSEFDNQSNYHYAIKFINEENNSEPLKFAEKCMTSFRDVSGECEIKIIDIDYKD